MLSRDHNILWLPESNGYPTSNDIETVAPARVGDTLGYARVSTHDQNPDAQSDRLIEAGAIRVFTDIVSGKRFEAARLSMGAYLRRRALGQQVRIAAELRLGAAELRELNRIEVNLNQMARALPQPLVLVFLGGVREWV